MASFTNAMTMLVLICALACEALAAYADGAPHRIPPPKNTVGDGAKVTGLGCRKTNLPPPANPARSGNRDTGVGCKTPQSPGTSSSGNRPDPRMYTGAPQLDTSTDPQSSPHPEKQLDGSGTPRPGESHPESKKDQN